MRGERPTARLAALALAALAASATAAAPSDHAYAEGALAQAVLRALRPLPSWRWSPGPPEGAAVRLGLRRPGDAWAEAYEPLALARLRDGPPPRWVRVRRKQGPADAAPVAVRDYDPVESGPARGRDAVHAVAYRLADAALVPEPVYVRRCRAEPDLCRDLAVGPGPEVVWGIFVRKDLAEPPGEATRDRLAQLSADPNGDRLLRRLGADWFLDGGAPARGAVPDLGGLVP